jgi:hypothetical protein
MHKAIQTNAATRRHIGRHIDRRQLVGNAAAPRIRIREMHSFHQGAFLVPDTGSRTVASSGLPLLRAPNQPLALLPSHDAIVKISRTRIPVFEERFVDSLQLRLQASLLNAQCYNQFAPELFELLTRTGLHEREAAAIAADMLKLLVESRQRPAIERDLRALIDTMMIPGHPELTVELALQHQLMLKTSKRLTQLLDHARTLLRTPGNAIDWGEGLLTFSSYSPDCDPMIQQRLLAVPLPDKWRSAKPQLEAGRYQAALSFDMLHRSPDIDESLQQIRASLLAGGRIYALETVLSDRSSTDSEHDRGRTLLHDYLLHWLLHPEKVRVNGNYLKMDQWPNRLRENGFKVCEVVDLGFDDSCPGNREALYIAEKA